MSRPYSYATRFVTGLTNREVISLTLEAMDFSRDGTPGEGGFDLLLRQHAPLPDDEEGRLNREALHRLVDAWLDGVEFRG